MRWGVAALLSLFIIWSHAVARHSVNFKYYYNTFLIYYQRSVTLLRAGSAGSIEVDVFTPGLWGRGRWCPGVKLNSKDRKQEGASSPQTLSRYGHEERSVAMETTEHTHTHTQLNVCGFKLSSKNPAFLHIYFFLVCFLAVSLIYQATRGEGWGLF